MSPREPRSTLEDELDNPEDILRSNIFLPSLSLCFRFANPAADICFRPDKRDLQTGGGTDKDSSEAEEDLVTFDMEGPRDCPVQQ